MEENNRVLIEELQAWAEEELEYLDAEEVQEIQEKAKASALQLIENFQKMFSEAINQEDESCPVFILTFMDTLFGTLSSSIKTDCGTEKQETMESFVRAMLS